MLISLNWLKQFVQLPDTLIPEELALQLKLHTVEVEKIEKQGALLDHIVVGKIKKVEKHPDADKLKVCVVDIGSKKLNVVCGGSNVREGMLVAMGMLGAKVQWHGKGEPIELIKAKIRGVESDGMICASDEIGLGELFPKKEEKEIIDLSVILSGTKDSLNYEERDSSVALLSQNDKVKLGVPLAEVLGLNDVIFEIDNKSLSNRPDLWGHYGIARELSALYSLELSAYNPPKIKAGKKVSFAVEVQDTALCPRYMAVVVENVQICPSPAWLQTRLRAVGIRPINNIVDITNFVMMDVGQPMHCFDAERLEGTRNKEQGTKKIIVRRAKSGEKLLALDEKEYTLTEEMLVIADENKPVAIAGVIGGQDSGVSENTHTIIFESANFDAASIRKTASLLGIRTDSSSRFEKSLDPHCAELALRRAVQLTQELCQTAKVSSPIVDVVHYDKQQKNVEFPMSFVKERIGVDIDKQTIITILKRLGFGVNNKKDILSIAIPTWRATKDIVIPEDIIEEIVRMYGYTNIPSVLPFFTITPPEQSALGMLERKIKELLAYEEGYTEVYNYSFESPEWLKRLGVEIKNYLEFENPVAKDRPLLRRNLIPNLLENVEMNAHRFEEVKLFEIGRTFLPEECGERSSEQSDELLPRQDDYLGIVYAGKHASTPFYELSKSFVAVCDRLGLSCEFVKKMVKDAPFIHPGRYAEVIVEGVKVGRIAELRPIVADTIGIPYRTAFLQINFTMLATLIKSESRYTAVSTYPEVVRDSGFVVEKKIEHAQIARALAAVDPLIAHVQLFDVYEGKGIPQGKKSMAYHIVYRSSERTLESAEVEKVHAKVIEMLKKKFGAEIRIG